MPDPIDSYRMGGDGMVHFYSGGQPALSAHASSPAVTSKIRAIDAARGGEDPWTKNAAYWRPVVDATLAEPQGQFPSMSAPPIVPGRGGSALRAMSPAERKAFFAEMERPNFKAHREDEYAKGKPSTRAELDLAALDDAAARAERDAGPRIPPGPPPGAMPPRPPMPPGMPPPGMGPPPGAMPPGMGGGPPPMPPGPPGAPPGGPPPGMPPGPPPGPPFGAQPMGAPPPTSALDDAYRRQMADTGSRFGGR